MQDPKEDECELSRHSSPESLPIRLAEIEMGIKLPPRLRFSPNIKDPTTMSKMIEIPSANGNDDVENTGYQEEVGRKDELVLVEMRNYS
jgi:hypothetical protein